MQHALPWRASESSLCQLKGACPYQQALHVAWYVHGMRVPVSPTLHEFHVGPSHAIATLRAASACIPGTIASQCHSCSTDHAAAACGSLLSRLDALAEKGVVLYFAACMLSRSVHSPNHPHEHAFCRRLRIAYHTLLDARPDLSLQVGSHMLSAASRGKSCVPARQARVH